MGYFKKIIIIFASQLKDKWQIGNHIIIIIIIFSLRRVDNAVI